jgi:hypothetical protein
LNAVIKIDEAYVENLNAAMKQAMAGNDLELAEKLDAERKEGIEKTAQDRALLTGNAVTVTVTDSHGYRLVKAVWYVPNGDNRPSIDVTEKIKSILRENTGDVTAGTDLFGDPQWGPHKELRIDYLRPNGAAASVTVPEYSLNPA